ncbi:MULTISPECIES: acyl-CoA dehydrogenase family protein [unclassified Saccharothrix]|uniref:acyl-CoA dehydrogenase family protein n=1 Tax=unclassified Saccharothrix TaxID=2593673 RepID=UPI00307F4384
MIDLDARTRVLREVGLECAKELADMALAVDADPDDMAPHLGSQALDLIRLVCTPARFRDRPLRLDGQEYGDTTCLQRVVGTAALARGDAGAVLAAPGPALAGIVVDVLGGPEQQERFHRALADGRTWSFFAMTEPRGGNDATGMLTRLDRTPDGRALHGAKRYIGNGARGDVGVVFARTGPSPLSIRAALVEAPLADCARRPLDTIGLKGARLSELTFAGTPVAEESLLGNHLPASRRGMWGAIRTFLSMRVQVAAMAVGTAQALFDRVREHRPDAPGVDEVRLSLDAAHTVLYEAAAAVDHEPERADPASVAKLVGTALGVRVARWAARSLGPASLLTDPLLDKRVRDVHGFEFMEGTTNIQLLQVAQARLRATGG